MTKSDDLAKNRVHDWRHIGYFWVFESEGNMWIPAALHIFKRVIEYVCCTAPASIVIKKLVFPADWTHVCDKILDLSFTVSDISIRHKKTYLNHRISKPMQFTNITWLCGSNSILQEIVRPESHNALAKNVSPQSCRRSNAYQWFSLSFYQALEIWRLGSSGLLEITASCGSPSASGGGKNPKPERFSSALALSELKDLRLTVMVPVTHLVQVGRKNHKPEI